MGNALEFIIKLTDMLSPSMRNAARLTESSAVSIQGHFDRITNKGRTMGASVNELRSRLEAVNKVRFSTQFSREFDIATAAARRLERQIDRLESKGKNAGPSIAGLISGAAIVAGGRSIIETGVKSESINRAVNFTTKGQGAAAMGQIDQISNKLGLNYEAGAEGFKTVSGGLRSLNYDLRQQMEIFNGVSAGIATFNLRAEDSKLVYLALGQIASKGTVQAEELRGQIGERIPGAFSIAARAMGLTEKQLNKVMDKGELMSKDFLPRFAAQMQKEFGQSAIDAATGAAANMNRFDNSLFKMKETLAKDLLPAFVTFLNALRSGLEWVAANKDIVLPLAAGIATVVLATQAWSIAQGVLNAVMALNPIIAIIGLIVVLGLWIYNLTKKYEGWGKSMQGLWDIIKGFVKLNVVAWKDFGESIWYWIQYAWLKLKSFVEYIGGALSNVNKALQLAVQFKFSEAKAALTAEIKTTASQQLVELEKRHANNQIKYEKEAVAALQQMRGGWNNIGLKKVKTGTSNVPGTDTGLGASVSPGGGGLLDNGQDKADKINSGGQRSIVINIGKQIENLTQYVTEGGGQEAATEIAALVREEVRKVFYSLNNQVN